MLALAVLGARLHITGEDPVREIVYSDGTTTFASIGGGDGWINASTTVNAPNFVTLAGADVNTMQATISNLSATVGSLVATAASQQAALAAAILAPAH